MADEPNPIQVQAAKQLLEGLGYIVFHKDMLSGDLVGRVHITNIPSGTILIGTALEDCLKGQTVQVLT